MELPEGRKLCHQCNKNMAVKGRPSCYSCTISPERKAVKNKKKKERARAKKYPWRIHKKDYCERCGFKADHPCQLDVDHIDGDKNNNNPSNYKTLCANCHRLKTFMNDEHKPLGQRVAVQAYVRMVDPAVTTA